jgi:RNA polymerase subunit RPABC4/transcription elongation factor Spt4
MEMVSLLVWSIVFAVVTTIVASTKGLSLVKWAGIGFILGPIGVIWVLVTARDQSALEAESLRSGKFKKCPFCAEVIKKDALVCKHCGGDQTKQPVPAQQKTYWVCPKCNETTETAKNTCWSCGAPKA